MDVQQEHPVALGLTTAEAETRRRRGEANTGGRAAPRAATPAILRTNVFSFFNTILFVIGAALLALGRYSDALISVGLGLVNAVISAVQEIRAKRKLDRLQLLDRAPVLVVRDGREVEVAPDAVVRGDVLRVRPGDQIVVDGPLLDGVGSRPTSRCSPASPTRSSRSPATSCGRAASAWPGRGHQLARDVGAASYAGRLTAEARRVTTDTTPLQRRIEFVVRLVMALAVLMSGAILAQAALEGFTLLRVVQITAVLSGLVPYGLFFLIAVAYTAGAAPDRRARRAGAAGQRRRVGQQRRRRLHRQDRHPHHRPAHARGGRAARRPGGGEVEAALGALARSATTPNLTTAALAAAPARRRLDGARRGAVLLVAALVGRRHRRRHVGARRAGRARPAPRRRRCRRDAVAARAPRAGCACSCSPAPPTRPPGCATPRAARRCPRWSRSRSSRSPTSCAPRSPRPSPASARTGWRSRCSPATTRAPSPRSPPRPAWTPASRWPAPSSTASTTPALDRLVARTTVFGRVAPEQKERIVASLRRQGHYVAMIGDGVNDARALKAAHVGVAMRSGSAVTRDVADIVLVDDSFAALLPAQREGRRIINGIAMSMYVFLARVATQGLVILAVTMLGLGFPYSPTQVGLTLLTVGVPTLFLTFWARPVPPDEHLLGNLARFVIPAAVILTDGTLSAQSADIDMVSGATVTSRATSSRCRARWTRRGCERTRDPDRRDRRPVRRYVEHVMGMPISLALRGRHADERLRPRRLGRRLAVLRDADRVFSTYRADSVDLPARPRRDHARRLPARGRRGPGAR